MAIAKLDKKLRDSVLAEIPKLNAELTEAFYTAFEITRKDFGAELVAGDVTGFLNWYESTQGVVRGAAMITHACKDFATASATQLSESLLMRHRAYAMTEAVMPHLQSFRIRLLEPSEINLSQAASSRLWMVTGAITLEMDTYI